ncbi:DedA family protein [Natronobacterium texcoconense]|uniref:Membrane protein DedA, SNARE-associated domain n=1 Tax=Natronobacterium texcoconense TaxID=1095778 RepID=A0A1H1FWH3_NATTX|nr:VTT domain-containing protein [Natronobacterium texcoconense]SDR05292.1 membrane protein DedA, SNARE-associated domain [Natronobacterium texcoconense]
MELETTLAELVLTVGVPVLAILYFLEGLFIGKLLHPSMLLILYIVVTEPGVVVMLLVPGICALAATAGQLVLYYGFNDDFDEDTRIGRAVPYFDRIPAIVKRRIGPDRMQFINRQFDRFGGKAICLSNATPGLRGLMTVVAGLNGYPRREFVLLSALGNAIYMVILLAVANGLLEAIQFLPEWDVVPS